MTVQPHVLAARETWIESAALDQLRAAAQLPGVRAAVGMPDLHPGKSAPIGAALAVQRFVYPQLVGSDIGCGMALWATDQPVHRLKLDRLEKRLNLEGDDDGPLADALAEEGAETGPFDAALGTIGGGNHFAELQRISRWIDPARAAELGLDARNCFVLIHSGSRGLGAAILRAHTDHFGAQPLAADSDAGGRYLAEHDRALRWARANRRRIAARMVDAVGCEARRVLDICHNSVTPYPALDADCWLHRKGAAPADCGPIVIPGSRGDLTYLVEPIGDGQHHLHSLAHGAGRKWERSAAKGKLGALADKNQLRRTKLGGRVICEDKALLFEEAPEAYKPIHQIIAPLVSAGLIHVIAELSPMLTYKTRQPR